MVSSGRSQKVLLRAQFFGVENTLEFNFLQVPLSSHPEQFTVQSQVHRGGEGDGVLSPGDQASWTGYPVSYIPKIVSLSGSPHVFVTPKNGQIDHSAAVASLPSSVSFYFLLR